MTTKKRIYSWWQNAVYVFCAALALVNGTIVATVLDKDVPGRPELSLAVFLVSLVAFGYLGVRAVRMGVSVDDHGAIRVRSLIRTWVLPAVLIDSIAVLKVTDGFGRTYCAPIIYLTDPFWKPSAINLWWLSAMTRKGAQIWVDRVSELLVSAKAGTRLPGNGAG